MKPKKEAVTSEQTQEVFLKLLSLYKRKCESFAVIPNLTLKQMLDKALDGLRLDNIKLAEVTGPIQMRALMESLSEVKYSKIKSIEIWKSKIGDEGIRNICKYLDQREGNIVQILDVLQNQITELGCEFLGKTFTYSHTKIKYLKLDDNLIGNKGLQNLSVGLRINHSLTKLSLKYCGIDEKGVKYLQDILANIHSKIRSIKLQGNPLRNEGIYQLLRVVQLNEMLEKVNIADTGLSLLDFVSKNLYVVDQNYIEENQEEEADQENPQKRETTPASNIENVKQIVLPQPKNRQEVTKQKVGVLKQVAKVQKKQHLKVTKTINENDNSLSAKILRLLTSIMRQNMLIRKYDLRFNPISDDAAIIIFEVIEQNSQIKDVQLNNNVDNTLRQNLDTLMRKRTGRLPKGRTRVSKGKKKKK